MPLNFAPYFRHGQPLKDFTYQNGIGPNKFFSYSAATMTGWKIMQEDMMLLKPEFCKKWSLFGVFDGHRGNHVASYLKDNYANHLEAYLDDCSPISALKLSFMSADNTIRRLQEEIISREEENDDVETSNGDESYEESSEERNPNVLHFLLSGPLQGEDTDKDDTDFEENKVLIEVEGDSLSESIPLEKINRTEFSQVKKIPEQRSEVCNLEETIPENEDLNKSGPEGTRGPKTNMNFKTSNLKLDEASVELQFEDTNKEDADFHENKILIEDEGDSLSESIPLEKMDRTEFSQVEEKSQQNSTVCNLEKTIPENEDLNKCDDYTECSKTDMNFKTSNQKSDKESECTFPGSTGTVVLFQKNKLFVANIGDTRCVASMKGKAVVLSKDHRPADPEERQRIINAGHSVIEGCIDGNLDVSRAFGDFELKTSKESEMKHAVITHPHVYAVYDIDNIEFIIIASDGVWNSMPDQEVIDFIKERRNTIPLEEINKELFDKVIAPARRSDGIGCDNITAILVQFRHRKICRTFTHQVDVPIRDARVRHKRNVSNTVSVIEHISEKEMCQSLELNMNKMNIPTIEQCDEGSFTSMTVTKMVPDKENLEDYKKKTLEQYGDVLWAPIDYSTLSVPVGLDVEIANEEMICTSANTRPQDKCDHASSIKHSRVILPYGEGHSQNFDAQDVEQICENKRSAEDGTIKHSKQMKCSSNEL